MGEISAEEQDHGDEVIPPAPTAPKMNGQGRVVTATDHFLTDFFIELDRLLGAEAESTEPAAEEPSMVPEAVVEEAVDPVVEGNAEDETDLEEIVLAEVTPDVATEPEPEAGPEVAVPEPARQPKSAPKPVPKPKIAPPPRRIYSEKEIAEMTRGRGFQHHPWSDEVFLPPTPKPDQTEEAA